MIYVEVEDEAPNAVEDGGAAVLATASVEGIVDFDGLAAVTDELRSLV